MVYKASQRSGSIVAVSDIVNDLRNNCIVFEELLESVGVLTIKNVVVFN